MRQGTARRWRRLEARGTNTPLNVSQPLPHQPSSSSSTERRCIIHVPLRRHALRLRCPMSSHPRWRRQRVLRAVAAAAAAAAAGMARSRALERAYACSIDAPQGHTLRIQPVAQLCGEAIPHV